MADDTPVPSSLGATGLPRLTRSDGNDEEAPVLHRIVRPAEGGGTDVLRAPDTFVSNGPVSAPPSRQRSSTSTFQISPQPIPGSTAAIPLPGAARERERDDVQPTRFVPTSFDEQVRVANQRTPEHRASERVLEGIHAVVAFEDGRVFRFRTIDASEQGVLLACARSAAPTIPLGAAGTIRLRFRDRLVEFQGELARVDDVPGDRATRARFAFRMALLTRDQQQEFRRLVEDVSAAAAEPIPFWRSPILLGAAAVSILLMASAAVYATRPVVVPVTTAPVVRGAAIEGVRSLRAEVVPAQRVVVRAPFTQSKLVHLDVRRGDRVKKGALVAHAEGAREQTLLASTRGRVAASEAQAKQAQSDLDRLSALGSDPQSLAHARDALRTAQAAAAASQSELRARTAELEGTRVVAPFDAVVAETVIENGDLVPPTAALVELIDDSHFTVRAAYAETDAARIRPDQEAQVAFAGVAEAQPGRVAHVGDVVRTETTGRTVSVDVDLAGTGFRTGTTAEVVVTLRRKEDTLLVPFSALRRDAAGSKVMVLDGKGKGVWRPVETGLTGGSAVEVLGGLSEGDVVVRDAQAPALDQPRVRFKAQ